MNQLALWFRSATLIRVRPRSLLLVPAVLLCLPSVASAGVFGGFAKDGQYRRGADQVCTPIDGSGAGQVCKTRSVGDLAKIKFTPGSKQIGQNRSVSARKQGTKIEVLATEGQAQLALWDAEQVLGAVGDVFLDSSKHWVAVEYQTRFAGRVVDDVVVLPVALPRAAAPTETSPATALPVKKTSESPEFRKAIEEGIRWSRRRRTHARAQGAFTKALKLAPEHPEALYYLAVLQSKRKDSPAVLAALARLAASEHTDKARWRVEARFELQFKPLRGDASFRKSVGIARNPGEQPSLYERLVALGGRWEQEAIPCEQPQVNLSLRRDKKRRFDLVIRSKCQGMSETTRLDGTWATAGKTGIAMSFPNMESADDQLTCRIERCADDSGEDCLRCQPDPELEFLLRIVRR